MDDLDRKWSVQCVECCARVAGPGGHTSAAVFTNSWLKIVLEAETVARKKRSLVVLVHPISANSATARAVQNFPEVRLVFRRQHRRRFRMEGNLFRP